MNEQLPPLASPIAFVPGARPRTILEDLSPLRTPPVIQVPPHERIRLDQVQLGDQLLAGQLTVTIDRISHEADAVSISAPHPLAGPGDTARIGWAGLSSSTVRRRTDAETG